jgi:hypothetical protein
MLIESADYRYLGDKAISPVERSSSSTSSGCGFEVSTLSTADFTTVTLMQECHGHFTIIFHRL